MHPSSFIVNETKAHKCRQSLLRATHAQQEGKTEKHDRKRNKLVHNTQV